MAVARICQLVDGMPLGVTLAAAWVRHLACTDIVREIEQTVDFLATSLRNTPARHRSMRAVFDYSWHLLPATEQETLAQLAIFPQHFSREAAQGIAHCTLLTLSELTDKSLLRRTTEGRYELHPLLRQFAAERLAAVGLAPFYSAICQGCAARNNARPCNRSKRSWRICVAVGAMP